jgi:hypothetical protein
MLLLGQVYRSDVLDTARHDQRQEAGIRKSPVPDENHRPESQRRNKTTFKRYLHKQLEELFQNR